MQRLDPHAGTADAIGVLAKPGADRTPCVAASRRPSNDRKLVVLTGDDRGVAEFPRRSAGGPSWSRSPVSSPV